nr:MAG TPA: hypothetical protein [Caudoviricetes sp.]
MPSQKGSNLLPILGRIYCPFWDTNLQACPLLWNFAPTNSNPKGSSL